mmetsp:Transcript_18318/g.32818  ORF Transcript_18318/g.32818 Transcript_18318/m.32818 type:complete len:100 (-) Transcript_18318:102-401(-)
MEGAVVIGEVVGPVVTGDTVKGEPVIGEEVISVGTAVGPTVEVGQVVTGVAVAAKGLSVMTRMSEASTDVKAAGSAGSTIAIESIGKVIIIILENFIVE